MPQLIDKIEKIIFNLNIQLYSNSNVEYLLEACKNLLFLRIGLMLDRSDNL